MGLHVSPHGGVNGLPPSVLLALSRHPPLGWMISDFPWTENLTHTETPTYVHIILVFRGKWKKNVFQANHEGLPECAALFPLDPVDVCKLLAIAEIHK